MVDFAPSGDKIFQDILFDPQNYGSLIICIGQGATQELLEQLQENLPNLVGLIGQVVAGPKGRIIVH